jgi:hypothetical protein
MTESELYDMQCDAAEHPDTPREKVLSGYVLALVDYILEIRETLTTLHEMGLLPTYGEDDA